MLAFIHTVGNAQFLFCKLYVATCMTAYIQKNYVIVIDTKVHGTVINV